MPTCSEIAPADPHITFRPLVCPAPCRARMAGRTPARESCSATSFLARSTRPRLGARPLRPATKKASLTGQRRARDQRERDSTASSKLLKARKKSGGEGVRRPFGITSVFGTFSGTPSPTRAGQSAALADPSSTVISDSRSFDEFRQWGRNERPVVGLNTHDEPNPSQGK
jgi:hypothetical protein